MLKKRPGASFVERTIYDIGRRLERAIDADELARQDGLLQKITPPVKTAVILVLMVDIALAKNVGAIAIAFAVGLVLLILSRVPISRIALRSWVGALIFTGMIALPALVLTPGVTLFRIPLVELSVTTQGLKSALLLIARVEAAVTFGLLLICTTQWSNLLKALGTLGVPNVFTVILGMTYRYIFVLLQTARSMFESRESRRVGKLSAADQRRLASASAGVLLARSHDLSGEVFMAMRSRGFRGQVKTIDEFALRGIDWATIGVAVLLAAAIFWLGSLSSITAYPFL